MFASSTPSPQRAPLLRIATLGDVTTTNVWALFDETGATYWNHATQSAYWARLYNLSLPTLKLEPAVAESPPAPIQCNSGGCNATITLRTGLSWTNGSPLTAGDVVFTVNTALQFQLGGPWRIAFNPQVLERAEMVNERVVRFHFHSQPGVAEWQYGVLQAPIVNQAYWQPRIADAILLLPEEDLLPSILELEQQSLEMKNQVEMLNIALNGMSATSLDYQQTVKQAKEIQEELNSINQKRDKARNQYEAQLLSARTALYALPNAMEPTLGAWKFESRVQGIFENEVHFGSVYGDPLFDKVRYIVFSDETKAVQALQKDEVDLILIPDGLSREAVMQLSRDPTVMIDRNSSRSARFLAFNQARPPLADTTMRQALACIIDTQALAQYLGGAVFPMTGFVLDNFWSVPHPSLPCSGLSTDARLKEAVRLLKSAGYTWKEEPAQGSAGVGLVTPSGEVLPRYTLLSTFAEDDEQRAKTSDFIIYQARLLGLELEARFVDLDALLYAVYGSGSYDLAVLGWNLSVYPDYLCRWFIPEELSPLAYNGSRLGPPCDAWANTSDLEQARTQAIEVQAILKNEFPLIPLYVETRYDAYRNLRYPFTEIIDGLGGLYGAPAQAIPNP